MSKANPGLDSLIDEVFQTHFATVGPGIFPIQRKVIRSVLEGNNTLALMPTGSGKSLCYWIAGKALKGITLVVFPLTALMDEQAQKLESHGCRVFTLHSGVSVRQQYKEMINLYNQHELPDYIFLSPERLATDGFLEFVIHAIRDQIKLVVVDEAHCISQWGLNFRPFYKEIPYFLNTVYEDQPHPTILGLTATLNPKDTKQICLDFGITNKNIIRSDMLLRPEINIKIVKVPDEDTKDQEFWALLEKHKDEKVLIYLDRKHGKRSTEALCAEAINGGYKAAYFHGDMTSKDKLNVLDHFKSGKLMMVFATSAFGMGIDIPDIRGVVHYLLTESTEQYYQQIGRAGRDGEPAWAVLFYSDKNIQVRKTHFIEKSFPKETAIEFAFDNLTDKRVGHRTVNYFEEGDKTQSAYHYLVRSSVIRPICKGITSLAPFKPLDSLPEFESYRNLTRSGILILTAHKSGKGEAEILLDLYRWIAEGKIKASSSLGKCLVINVLSDELPPELMASILEDVEEKKAYRHEQFAEFVRLLKGYTNTFEFHKSVGEHLGIDRFSQNRIYKTLSGDLVRSKSEVIVANILFQSKIPFTYEESLFAPDGTWRWPDFTVSHNGKIYYWEHVGMLGDEGYARDWKIKKAWYERNFPNQLITTEETSTLSQETKNIIAKLAP
jgi:ATP-dependent DNA helicase RecQ